MVLVFHSMITENKNKEKTGDIKFESLKMSKYLEENKRRSLSKLIFSVRSKTLDIKDWCPWKYVDVNCVACGKFPEIMDHFTTCEAYRNEPLPNWHDINGTATDKIITVGLAIERRVKERDQIIWKHEAGRVSIVDSTAPGDC